MNPTLHHPKRVVRNPIVTAAFYETILGIVPYKWTSRGFIGRWKNQTFEFTTGSPAAKKQPGIRRDVDHWAFKGACVEQASKILDQNGIEHKLFPIGEGEAKATQIFFQDPDGHYIEIIVRDSDNDEGYFDNPTCDHINHKGIHHLSIVVSDLAASACHYQRLLNLTSISRPELETSGFWFRAANAELHLVAGTPRHHLGDGTSWIFQGDHDLGTYIGPEGFQIEIQSFGNDL